MRHIHIRLPVPRLRWVPILVTGSIVAGVILMTSYRNAPCTNERVDIDIPVTTSAVVRAPVLSEPFLSYNAKENINTFNIFYFLRNVKSAKRWRTFADFFLFFIVFIHGSTMCTYDNLALTGQPVDMSINLFSGPVKVLQSSQIQVSLLLFQLTIFV